MGVTCRRVADQVPQSHIARDPAWVTDKRGRRRPDLAFSNCFGKKIIPRFLETSTHFDLRCALRCIQCWKAGRRLKSNEKIITGHKGLHSYLLLGWLPPWQDCARPNNPPQGLVAQTARAKIQGHPRSVDHLCLRYYFCSNDFLWKLVDWLIWRKVLTNHPLPRSFPRLDKSSIKPVIFSIPSISSPSRLVIGSFSLPPPTSQSGLS